MGCGWVTVGHNRIARTVVDGFIVGKRTQTGDWLRLWVDEDQVGPVATREETTDENRDVVKRSCGASQRGCRDGRHGQEDARPPGDMTTAGIGTVSTSRQTKKRLQDNRLPENTPRGR